MRMSDSCSLAGADPRRSGTGSVMKIGPYEIVELLGRGAMGEVYKAIDFKLNGRSVALKILSDLLSRNQQALTRFEREVEVAAKLNHPNIITIHDQGVHEGRHYFVMEYIDGTDLAAVIEERPDRPIEGLMEIASQVCDALEFAHSQGMIHRDIKPANIMIARRGGHDHAKIVDFGIVHVDRSKLTLAQTQPGTYVYMSPEQLRNEGLDHRSDLFSFGIVLYELFTGVHPFDAASEVLITNKILQEDPEPAKSVMSSIPTSLDSLILKLLEKEPGQRPQTTGEVSAALRQILRKHQSRGVGSDPGDYHHVDELTRPMVESLVRFARSKEAEGDLEGAIEALEKAVALAPDVERITRKLQKVKHRKEAEKKLRLHLNDARAALAEGRLQDATHHVKDAWILSPESSEVVVLEEEIKKAAAAEKRKATPPSSIERVLEAVQDEMNHGQLNQARKHLLEAIRQSTDDMRPKVLLDRLLRVVEWGGDYVGYRRQLERAERALDERNLRQARSACAQAGELWPEDLEWKSHEQKIEVEIAHAINSKVSDAKRLIRQAEDERNDPDQALELVQQAMAMLEESRELGGEPKLASPLLQQGERLRFGLQARKRREEQERAKRKRMAELAERAQTLFRSAVEYEQAGPDDAERALDAYGQSQEVYLTLQEEDPGRVEARERLGEIGASIRRVNRIIEEREDRAREIEKRLRDIEQALGDAEKARHGEESELSQGLESLENGRSQLSRVLEVDSTHTDARQLLHKHDSLKAAIERRLEQLRQTRETVEEGLHKGRALMARAQGLAVSKSIDELTRGKSQCTDAEHAFRRILTIDETQEEALRALSELEVLSKHFRFEIQRRDEEAEEHKRKTEQRFGAQHREISQRLERAGQSADGNLSALQQGISECDQAEEILEQVEIEGPVNQEVRALRRRLDQLRADLQLQLRKISKETKPTPPPGQPCAEPAPSADPRLAELLGKAEIALDRVRPLKNVEQEADRMVADLTQAGDHLRTALPNRRSTSLPTLRNWRRPRSPWCAPAPRRSSICPRRSRPSRREGFRSSDIEPSGSPPSTPRTRA